LTAPGMGLEKERLCLVFDTPAREREEKKKKIIRYKKRMQNFKIRMLFLLINLEYKL